MSPARLLPVRARAWIARATPKTVVEYPFEVFVSVLGLITGVPLLAGLARPNSLALLLPPYAFLAYAVALVLGAVTVAIALRKRHAGGIAMGLQLLGGSFSVYAIAIVAVAGWVNGWAAFAAFICLGLVTLIRTQHFRRIIDIQIGARRLSRRT